MTDKIITTFETTLTWYVPFDVLPDINKNIICKMKGENKISTFVMITNGHENIFVPVDLEYAIGFGIGAISRWAYLPDMGGL